MTWSTNVIATLLICLRWSVTSFCEVIRNVFLTWMFFNACNKRIATKLAEKNGRDHPACQSSCKHLWWSLFRPTTLLKRTPTQAFSGKFCKIFKDTYFVKYLRTAASERLWCNKVLLFGKSLLKEHVSLKHVLYLYWNLLFSLIITFSMEYC